MNLNYSAMVRQRVESMPAGSVFFIQDFADIAGEDSVRQALCRLARQGTIRRLMNGVFDKPAADPRIGTFPPAQADQVAAALARHRQWDIAPYGRTALDRLGLTRVPSHVSTYVSTGPYKRYSCCGLTLEFHHRDACDISPFSPITVTVMQALEALGPQRVDRETVAQLRRRLPSGQLAALRADAADIPGWMGRVMDQICVSEAS